MKAGNFLKYFVLAVVAINLALVACVFLSGLAPKPKPSLAPSAPSTNSTNATIPPATNLARP